METPRVEYVLTADGVRIAYQAYGTGPPTVVVPPFVWNVELGWEEEVFRPVLEHLGRHLRVVIFDKRGMGMSDRFDEIPTLQQRLGDIEAVMGATGLDRANLYGISEGGKMVVAFAAAYPDRVNAVAIANTGGGATLRDRAYTLAGMAWPDEQELEEARTEDAGEHDDWADWGVDARRTIATYMPSRIGDDDFARRYARYERLTISLDGLRRQSRSLEGLEIADDARRLRGPTQIVHLADDSVLTVGFGRALAEIIPNAEYLELPGSDHFFWAAPYWRDVVDRQIEFLTGAPARSPSTRRFVAVLFTDIVGSTAASLAAGDATWKATIESHDRRAAEVIARHAGTLIKTTGDGVLAIFDSPSLAIDAAADLRDTLATMDLEMRAGMHAGEVEIRPDDVSGAVVNLAARVEQAASDGEILVTAAMADLLIGGRYLFEDAGRHRFKGFDREWDLARLS